MSISLYIHIPWCVRKCPYCDFNSHQQKNELPEDQYVNRLLEDLDNDITTFNISDRPLQSIFFGGGTPSLFSSDAIKQILDGVKERLTLSKDCEITLEANPGTFEVNKFFGFRMVGVNRLSIGIQSFNAEHLQKLGRIHDVNEANQAIETAFLVGFKNVNVDLMYALPKQNINQAINDLSIAFDYPITHLSHYQLTLEPNTLFAKYPPKLPEEDAIWDMQLACQELITKHGFKQYEISAYAKTSSNDLRAKHNLNYWRFGDYLGIGAGAHGKITLKDDNQIRTMKPKHPKQYLDNQIDHNFQSISHIKVTEIAFEYMLNRLRLNEAFSQSDFEISTGRKISDIESQLNTALDLAWLKDNNEHYQVTALGHQFLNDFQALFLPDRNG